MTERMRVLVACEFSGVVRDAFLAKGHDAYSCDLEPTERERERERHVQCDVLELLTPAYCWDLLIAFPPCTHLSASGARWWPQKKQQQQEAFDFVRALLEAPVGKIALENPIGIISSAIRRPEQIIQPWQFGRGETKATCLWLAGLPKLTPTNVVPGREQKCWRMPPSKDRAKNRSRTYQGIADAMADQWG